MFQESHALESGDGLAQERELLLGLRRIERRHTGGVAPGFFHARHHLVRDRIDHDREHDRDGRGHLLNGPDGHRTHNGDHVRPEIDELGDKRGKSRILPFRTSWLDDKFVTVTMAEGSQFLSERLE